MRFNKKIVTGILLFMLVFTIAILVIFIKTGNEPGVTVGAVYAACTGELWSLAKIKTKERETYGYNDNNTGIGPDTSGDGWSGYYNAQNQDGAE